MKINILTLFPEMFESLNASILKRAIQNGILQINVVDIRSHSKDKHFKCDDYPFGGGAGMVMSVQPIDDAFNSVDSDRKTRRIYLSPKGKTLNQQLVTQLAKEGEITLLCGHYEGIDQRAIDMHIDEEISIGDYVLTGGELPAMVLIDCVSRYIDGVLGSSESVSEESFSNNLLEYPQYTRPQEYKGLKVPDILLSGNHGEVEKWRKTQQIEITKKLRPDLLK